MMVLCSPLLAMSYFATEDGAKSYAAGSVQAWAEPARRLLEPLLTFASADRVYATYSLLIASSSPPCRWQSGPSGVGEHRSQAPSNDAPPSL